MVVFYNTRNLPRQDYTIISYMDKPGRWTGQALIQHSMNPMYTPEREITAYQLEGEDGEVYWVDANTLLMAMMHHSISITNGRVVGYTIRYY